MAGLLTLSSTLMCPHGAPVTATAAGPRPSADGTPILLSTDTCTIAGCAFQLPGPAPSPCVSVTWTVTNTKSTSNGTATLGANSQGLCMSAASAPQGNVVIVLTQAKVTGS